MTIDIERILPTDKELDRFNSKVVQGANGCMVWHKPAMKDRGYGEFHLRGGRIRAHRFAYIWAKGRIPDGYVIDHLCRNTMCVNPEHLEAVTQHENILRGISPSALKAKQTICKNGHEFTEANTFHRPEGGRRCLTCYQAYHKKVHEDLKEQRRLRGKRPSGFAVITKDKNGMTGSERAAFYGRVKNKRKKGIT